MILIFSTVPGGKFYSRHNRVDTRELLRALSQLRLRTLSKSHAAHFNKRPVFVRKDAGDKGLAKYADNSFALHNAAECARAALSRQWT